VSRSMCSNNGLQCAIVGLLYGHVVVRSAFSDTCQKLYAWTDRIG